MANRDLLVGEAALAHELKQETAQALGRAGKRMEAALAAIAACEPGSPALEEALDAAAWATYAYVVQREMMGLTDTDGALEFYKVPLEVRNRMGVARTSRTRREGA